VHDGSEQDALALLAPHAEGLSPVAWATLLDAPPKLVEGGVVVTCEHDPLDAGGLDDSTRDGRSGFLYGEFDAMSDKLAGVVARLPCAVWTVSGEQLGALYLELGLNQFHAGKEPDAAASFRSARAANPELVWDADLPPAAAQAFEGAVAGEEVKLSVVAGSGRGVWLDGAPVVGEVVTSAGPHLVQTEGEAALVELGASNSATLVFPGSFSAEGLGVGEARASVTALLAATQGEGASVWVASGGSAWKVTAGRTDWELVVQPHPTGPTDTAGPAPPSNGLHAGHVLLGGGSAVAVGSGVALALGYAAAGRHGTAYTDAKTAEGATQSRADFEASARGVAVTRWACVAGGALALTGGAITVARGVSVSAQGAGLQLRVLR
jgi:hypothetical protein